MNTLAPLRTIAPQSFRSAYRQVPGPVAVVLTRTETGTVVGITCTSATSLSADPAMATFSVDVKTSFLGSLEATRVFSVNYLAADRVDVARAFARGGDDLARIAHLIVSDPITSIPTLGSGTVAVLQCELDATLRCGDHDLVTGAIVRSRYHGDETALVYSGGAYGAFLARSY
ncbi:hypothetical protein GCM10025768_01450 [Microbacterium pseudoresistens]|uniref:Flavin reductase (DIM6/NTAB) family NADH-FMN oxidoreductase RutF n=1 Tax=Microbacterium pseudoresistens TaxID=640634 RepID=A0A7Y9JM35_9MICO|nr:flavin reductase family protein [Microbacterium pseudoresistens]NYD53980.1 flavin reductase (DIM6/NTAB) family NADH-FMN oxidoreductase RutF [Microbacterium pseudoresistens]